MMKKLLLILLLITVLTYAFLATFNIPTKYVITPYQYCRRIVICVKNAPDVEMLTLQGSFEKHQPEYVEVFQNHYNWQRVELNGINDIGPAIEALLNNLGQCFTGTAISFAECIKNLWHNFMELIEYSFSPVTMVFDNISQVFNAFAGAKEWRHDFVLSLFPFDWQQCVEDGYDMDNVRIPLIGDVVRDSFGKYFGSNKGQDGWRGGR